MDYIKYIIIKKLNLILFKINKIKVITKYKLNKY